MTPGPGGGAGGGGEDESGSVGVPSDILVERQEGDGDSRYSRLEQVCGSDPDLAFHCTGNADPNPVFHFNTDQDQWSIPRAPF